MRGRFLLAGACCAALISSCSPSDNRQGSPQSRPAEERRQFDVTEEPRAAADVAAPGISPTAAPGVAFNYRYAFRLPNTKIAAVQEQHAAACEKLGIAKCRITGMQYRLVDSHTVEGMLAFKLDPVLARQFGKDGIAAVTASDGMLVDSEISGIDEGANIRASNVRSDQLRAELADIDNRIADKATSETERSELRRRADEIRSSQRSESQSRTDSAEAIANTPMVFHYGSGSAIPGFDGQSPLKDAWNATVRSFLTGISFIMMALGVILPWLLILILALKLWWSAPIGKVRRWVSRRDDLNVEKTEPETSG